MLRQAQPVRKSFAAPARPATAATEPPTMTYAQFLRLDGPSQHVEWVDGKVIEMAAVSNDHTDLGVFLIAILGWWVELHDAGQIKCEPFQMKTGPALPGRAPDVFFVAKRNLSRLKRLYLDGPADVAIEIISEGSRAADRGEKYYEYERGGVKEYWLLDPIRRQAEFYRLGRDKVYHLVPVGDDGIFRSDVLKGVWLKTEWLWRKPLPSVLTVHRAWKM